MRAGVRLIRVCRAAGWACSHRKLPPMRYTSLSPSTCLRLRRYVGGKSIRIRRKSVRPIAPLAVEFLQQFFGRRDAAGDRFFQRPQIARLIAAIAVDLCAVSVRGSKAQCSQCQSEHIAIANFRLESQARHVVSKFLPLFYRPRLDHVPTSVERIVIVEQPNPIGRERGQSSPGTSVGSAHFKVTFEPHFGKNGAQMVGPI